MNNSILFGLGPVELAVIAILGILLFGKRLPRIGGNLDRLIAEYRKGSEDDSGGDDGEGGAGVPARLKPKPPTLDGMNKVSGERNS